MLTSAFARLLQGKEILQSTVDLVQNALNLDDVISSTVHLMNYICLM